jgi:MYXO-CTERM domain-containing protein
MLCATADDCVETGFTDPVCGSSLGDLPDICRPHCGTMVGCSVDGDCRPFRTFAGVCLRGADGATTTGICAYRGLGVSYCTDGGDTTIEPLMLAHCHLRPDGSVTSDYFEGDCDQDGCANGGDVAPCVAGEEPCGTPDLTIACSNATPDAGVPERDAGAPIDAGSRDAGIEPFDAGATEPGIDANQLTGVSFGGGGGVRCSCRTTRAAPPSPLGTLAVAAVALTVAGRRRLGSLERR